MPGLSADSSPAAAPGGILAAEGVPGAAVVVAVADAIDGTNGDHCVEGGACAAVSGQTQQRTTGRSKLGAQLVLHRDWRRRERYAYFCSLSTPSVRHHPSKVWLAQLVKLTWTWLKC